MGNKIRILHIDDNFHDRQIVKNILQKEPDEFEVIETDNHLEFDLHLSKSDFDLILSEFNIPGLEGLNVLQIVKEKKPEIPVIIVTGKGTEEIAAEAMKLGAADYVIKSEKHIQNLRPTIRKVIENRKIQDKHKATLIALHKSEERFRLLFDNSMDAVFLNVPDGAILEANTTACNIFGRTQEGLKQVGRNGIIDVTDPRLAIALEERSRTGKCNGELTGLRKDGTPFPIEISSVLFQDNDGSPRSSMVIRDITERKRVEESLRESEGLYRNLFESLLNGFAYCRMLFDKERPKDFIYLRINKAFETLTGLKDVVGKKVSDVIPGIQESDPELFEIYGRVALTGIPETFEIYVEALKLWFLISVYSPQKEYFVAIFDVITNRKQAEEGLKASEVRYRRLFESAKDGILILDAESGMIVDVNPFLVELLGYSTEQFHGKKIWEIGIFSDIIANHDKFLELQQKEYVRYDDLPLKTSDGRQIDVEFVSNVYEVNHHKVIQCNIRNITERKRAEETIEKERSMLKILIDNLPSAVFAKDSEYRNILANTKHLSSMAGHLSSLGLNSKIDYNGKTDFEIYPKELAEKYFIDDQKVIRDGYVQINKEEEGISPDGKPIWLLVSKIPLRDNGGIITGLVGITTEITERKLTEELLAASEIRYRRLFESAKDGILILDAESGMIVDVNPYLVELLGYSTEQFHGKKIWEIGIFSDIIANQSKFLELQQKEYVRYDDLPLKTSDGRQIAVEFVSNVYKVKQQKVIQCNIRNITERKKSEEQRIIQTTALEATVISVVITDAEGTIAWVNNAFTLLTGFSKEEAIGKNPRFLKSGKQDESVYKNMWDTIKSGMVWRGEIINKRKDNSLYSEEITITPVRDKVGIVRNFIALKQDITERKKTEEQQITQTTALEATAISVVITDAEGTITWVNNAFTMMTGYSKEEAIGKNPSILKSGKHDKSFYKNMWDTIKAGNVWRGEVFNKRKDDSLLTDEMTITPVLDKDGVVRNFIALKHDITERKRISEALHENEQLLSQTQHNANIGSFRFCFNGIESKWTDEMYNIFGVQKDTFNVTTDSFLNCIHPDDRTSMQNWIGQTSSGIKTEDLDFRIVKPDGTIRYICGAGMLQSDKDGKANYIIGSAQDITERKNIEQALKESEGKFRSLLENSADAIFITDPIGKYIYTNKAVTDLLGYTSEQMLIKTIADLAPKDKIESYFEMFKVVLNKGKYFAEIELLKNDGNFVSTDLNAVLLPNGFVYASCRDITERKQAEAEIRNLNASLELKVEERTKKLSKANINLKEANVQAEHANQAKSEFLSNMSHEIRTPMNAVLGYAELLNNLLEDKTQKDYLNSIMSSGKTLLTLINDILDLSKIEAGKLELTFDFVNTHSFFSEFERIFSWKVAEKGLTFILDIVSGIPAGIYVDETRLRQILLNIIGNAVKFTQKGHIKLKVYIENPQIVQLSNEKSEEFIDLIIEIEDTGIGISSEFQDQIFEPFSQEQHKNQFGGTGLGLAITRRLLTLMNGTIQLQSKLNKGTSFQIKIPNIAYIRDFERKTYSVQIDPANIKFGKATILIADDIAHNRKYFVDALINTNIEIVEAEDGLTAYNLAKDIVPDLIITDLRMPKLDGFGLLKKIQGNAKLRHIPVIAYSASAMKKQKEHIFNCEFSGLLIKPVRVTDLYIELMNYLPYTSTLALEKDHPTQQGLLEEINDMQSLIHSLETVYTDVWKKFKVRQPMDEVREFGKNIENLGNAHHAETIKKYGNELMLAAENFNIETILKLLHKYQGIVKEIKEYHSNN